MSMKVLVLVQVSQMDGTDVCLVSKLDTAINPNARDPTGEVILVKSVVERVSQEVVAEAGERLDEYQQALERYIGG